MLTSLKLFKPFLLIVGTREPRKNMKRMVEAWLEHRDMYDCVVIGAAGWDELPHHQGLHILGYLDAKELASLYRSAVGLLFASLYEGFGLPILEAFFHGCPVATSRVSSMPEVAGEAAIYVNPFDVQDIAKALHQILCNPTLRETLSHKAQRNADRFSWKTAAEQTLAIFAEAIEIKHKC